MVGRGALLAVLTTMATGCDSFPSGNMTIEATEEQQECARVIPIPPASQQFDRLPAISTTVGEGFIFIQWCWQNHEPLDREVVDVVRRVRVLRDLMVSQCGVDPSTIECIAKDNVGRLCP